MSERARLARIADAHHKHVDEHGGTSDDCTTDRDAAMATWDPHDDEVVPDGSR